MTATASSSSVPLASEELEHSADELRMIFRVLHWGMATIRYYPQVRIRNIIKHFQRIEQRRDPVIVTMNDECFRGDGSKDIRSEGGISLEKAKMEELLSKDVRLLLAVPVDERRIGRTPAACGDDVPRLF